MAQPWSQIELDLIVADYFAMLVEDVCGRAYNKAAHNRALREHVDRSAGSVEFKHQNISAVLKLAGQPHIPGYLPAYNIQQALRDTVRRWLVRNPDWLPESAIRSAGRRTTSGGTGGGRVAEADFIRLFYRPPPARQNEPPPVAPEEIERIAGTFDAAGRDARNKVLGDAGEELVLWNERASLRDAGRPDLADKVRWTAKEDGDGFGYDIASFQPDGRVRLLEVKTTNGWDRTPFYLTRNECRVADARREEWTLLRLYDYVREPKAFEFRPPLDANLALTPTLFRAQLL